MEKEIKIIDSFDGGDFTSQMHCVTVMIGNKGILIASYEIIDIDGKGQLVMSPVDLFLKQEMPCFKETTIALVDYLIKVGGNLGTTISVHEVYDSTETGRSARKFLGSLGFVTEDEESGDYTLCICRDTDFCGEKALEKIRAEAAKLNYVIERN